MSKDINKKRNFFEAFATSSKSKIHGKQPLEKKQVLEDALSKSAIVHKEQSDRSGNPPKQVEDRGTDITKDAKVMNAQDPQKDEEEESTDFKLALLSSLQPGLPPETLLEFLLTCNGSVEDASKMASSSPSKKPTSGVTTQSSLSTYLSGPPDASQSTRKIPFPLPAIPKFKTLHLTTPSQVPFYAPTTLHPSFLPTSTANKLLSECLGEVPSFGRYEFRLFERNVSSPHTAAFYVKDQEMAERHRGGYMYNGSYLDDIRTFTPTMHAVIPLVEAHVNAEINNRIQTVYPDSKKLKHMLPPGKWHITSAFMNCYDGAKQSVGWHSDQLTYLGPRSVIASISLGVEREFRLRRVAPVILDTEVPFEPEDEEYVQDEEAGEEGGGKTWKWQSEGQASIHLPHNSLLVMHAECQESWKHSIHPANNIQPHPVAGGKRINITFRCYRESLRPDKIPKCKCGVGCVLKTVQRVKEKMGWYFWGCQVANQWKEGEDDESGKGDKKEAGCGYLVWAKFDEDGDPIWE
ncbi:hypothetical protein H072_478 [Dactylellina haptotyla CBS 200.50]|uniref:Uncharacterized protein n=1 Tax=Dactylellina haptotyla (strain CBS 200.50) TaxID=1284197 RepID=S8C1D1_DACHA|nr:hypothetical protein H072_478 [Dactylellina haptotyla CBS 200.50]